MKLDKDEWLLILAIAIPLAVVANIIFWVWLLSQR